MMPQHRSLASGRWATLSFAAQMGNIGSEVARMLRWKETDATRCEQAFVRALELLDLTIQDGRWRARLKELTRVRECLCDAMSGGYEYGSTLEDLDKYFLAFATAARAGH